jgi:hypothetical protein
MERRKTNGLESSDCECRGLFVSMSQGILSQGQKVVKV